MEAGPGRIGNCPGRSARKADSLQTSVGAPELKNARASRPCSDPPPENRAALGGRSNGPDPWSSKHSNSHPGESKDLNQRNRGKMRNSRSREAHLADRVKTSRSPLGSIPDTDWAPTVTALLAKRMMLMMISLFLLTWDSSVPRTTPLLAWGRRFEGKTGDVVEAIDGSIFYMCVSRWTLFCRVVSSLSFRRLSKRCRQATNSLFCN